MYRRYDPEANVPPPGLCRMSALSANAECPFQVCDNWTNFRQYKLPPPAGLLRMDAHVPAFRAQRAGVFDAIVTDPPYGIRAGGRRSLCLSETGMATKEGQQRALVTHCLSFPAPFLLCELFCDEGSLTKAILVNASSIWAHLSFLSAQCLCQMNQKKGNLS